jgi:hypothetical protein
MYMEVPCPQKSCTLYISADRHNVIHPTIILNLFFQQSPPSAVAVAPLLQHSTTAAALSPNPTPQQGEIRRGEGRMTDRAVNFLCSYLLACAAIISHAKPN